MINKIKRFFFLDRNELTGGQYFSANVIRLLALIVVVMVVVNLIIAVAGADNQLLNSLISAAVGIIVVVISISVLIKTTLVRLHTLKMSDRWIYLIFVPFVNLLFMAYLCLKKFNTNQHEIV